MAKFNSLQECVGDLERTFHEVTSELSKISSESNDNKRKKITAMTAEFSWHATYVLGIPLEWEIWDIRTRVLGLCWAISDIFSQFVSFPDEEDIQSEVARLQQEITLIKAKVSWLVKTVLS